MTDVVLMVQQGHDERVIITQIRNSGSTFNLTAADLDFLRTNNVPSAVILEMQNARPLPARVRPVVVHEQPTVIYQEPSVVYVRPAPPPPGVWVHGRW